MAETHHLQKRGQNWHYYRRVPTALVPLVGKAFVKKSLGTSDLKVAKILRNALNVQIDAEFAAAEAQGDGAPPPAPVSLAMLTEHLRQHIAGLDQRSAARLVIDPPETEAEKAEMKQDAEIGLGVLKNRDDPRGAEWVASVFDKVTAKAGASLSDKEVVSGFAEIVRRGLMELQHRKLDRLRDEHGAGPHDPLFDPSRPSTVTFGELVEMFWTERTAEYAANGISAKRSDKVRAELDFVLEALGEETPLHQINDDTIQAFRKTLDRTPANRRKVYPKLSLVQAQERAAKEGKTVLSPVTQAQYIRTLRDVLAVGLRKGLLRHNPAIDVKPLKKNKTAAAEKRLPWTDEQLVGFFTGSFYQSCASGAAEPYSKKDRGWRFWLPLVMLFSGARPNEICQLHTSDLKQTKAGTWYLDLMENEDDEVGKTFKTSTSRRRVPLHPELLKIGFVQFLAARKKKHGPKEPRLFPEITPDSYGNMATYPARRFREHFIPQEITLGERQTLYSLRHCTRDALRRAKAPPEALLHITGWAPAGKAVSDAYGDPGNPDLHAEYVEAITYPGLDLSFLYGTGAGI